MAIKVIFFDFFGTLAENGVKSPIKEVKFILRLRNIDFSTYVANFEEAFMTKNFNELREGFEEVINHFNIKVPEFVIENLIGLWNKNTILAKPYEDTIPTLEDLKKDYKLVLLCNSDNFSVNLILEKFDLKKYFDVIALSCDTGFLKSNSSSFESVLKQLKLKKSEAIMVGDSVESDIKSAENAGIKSVLIDRNNRQEFENKILSLSELKEHLK